MNKDRLDDFFNLISISAMFSKENKPKNDAFRYLHNKIYRDFICILNLLAFEGDDFKEQACIILRSTIEAVLIYCNLLCDETMCDDFLSDSQLFEFADLVVFYSNLLDLSEEEIQQITGKDKGENARQLKCDIEQSFKVLTDRNKQLILKKMELEEFCFDINKLQNFCRHYTPFLSNVFKMLEKLDEYKIYGARQVNSVGFVYGEYSKLSHRIHNCYPYFKSDIGEKTDKIMTVPDILHLMHVLNMNCLLAIKFNKKLAQLPNEIIEALSKYLCGHYGIEDVLHM